MGDRHIPVSDRPGGIRPTESGRWEALRRRDGESGFFYGVRTTRVYCRPGCASRPPNRENVVFFDGAGQAEQAGYRACKRCRPDVAGFRGRHADAIVRACRLMAEAEAPIPLKELADAAGLSAGRFHRVFKEVVGITPKQYAAARRARLLADGLRQGGTVTQAIYDAGFGSSSRVYEQPGALLGMTPHAYKKGAPDLRIRYAVAESSLGWVLVAATDRGLCAIEFGESPAALTGTLKERFPKAEFKDGDPEFTSHVARVIAFLEAPQRRCDLPLDIRGTAFQRRVWHALRSIPPGGTMTYAEIAARIGNPKAARAVAGACAANALAVAVPCHRAVRGDGGLGGYRGGIGRKKALLDRETKAQDPLSPKGGKKARKP